MTNLKEFPEYQACLNDKITKDGHTMFAMDIAKELNRKSFLESKVIDMQSDIDKWHKAYLTAMNEFDKKCKSLNEISSRCRDEESYNSYLVDELESYGNPENWTQSYDCHGKLISQHALFLPRLK